MNEIINIKDVEAKVLTIRQQAVLLAQDVAELYGVETREVSQAIKNNPRKFPDGYVFELTSEEVGSLRSKFLILENGVGRGRHSKRGYKAFTEKGLYMLATILKGERASKRSSIDLGLARWYTCSTHIVNLRKEQRNGIQRIEDGSELDGGVCG